MHVFGFGFGCWFGFGFGVGFGLGLLCSHIACVRMYQCPACTNAHLEVAPQLLAHAEAVRGGEALDGAVEAREHGAAAAP